MINLLILAGGAGIATAATALLVRGRQTIDQRFFAALISIAVTVVLFSIIAWVATAIAAVAPRPLVWVLVGMLAVLFALRLYRELRQGPPPTGSR